MVASMTGRGPNEFASEELRKDSGKNRREHRQEAAMEGACRAQD
jgi:hypothetical protein